MLYTGLPLFFFYCCFFISITWQITMSSFILEKWVRHPSFFFLNWAWFMDELYLKCVSKTVCVCVWWHTAVTYSCLLCQSTWLQSELTHWPCAVIRRRGQLSCEQPYDLKLTEFLVRSANTSPRVRCQTLTRRLNKQGSARVEPEGWVCVCLCVFAGWRLTSSF